MREGAVRMLRQMTVLNKLEATRDRAKVALTRIACRLLDDSHLQMRGNYADAASFVPECICAVRQEHGQRTAYLDARHLRLTKLLWRPGKRLCTTWHPLLGRIRNPVA